MCRLLVIPAAGAGSRLGGAIPKVLVPVAGTPMLDRILDLYREVVDRTVVIVNPASERDVRRHVGSHRDAARIECVVQTSPTGMLDAILLAMPAAARYEPSSVWVTWCDQVTVHPKTVERLSALTSPRNHAAIVMPTVTRERPYIHLERDRAGRIARVLHRREGDAMPAVGESDMGLFAMSPQAFRRDLPAFAATVETGHATGERNFLPFIPWIAQRDAVTTFASEDPMEAVGVNTPEELALVERYLSSAL
jgi:bifunctional UDP-N-acetylglucosamine pyrophosphorylase/glucosamine-1-phosphate N-acetyltransferase